MSVPVTLTRHKLTGVCPPARAAVFAELCRAHPAPAWLVVAEDLRTAEHLAEDVAFFHAASGNPRPHQTLVFPESMPDTRDMREAFAASSDRLTVLSRLRAIRGLGRTPDTVVVVTTPAALLQPVPALEEFAIRELTLARGQVQSFQGLLEQLQKLDYDSEAVCEAPGHYAIRGGIIDVYPVTAGTPYRLDFFGDELEEIREFDPVTQRSGASVASISLAASPRVKLDPSKTGLADYLSPGTHLLFLEPASLEEEFSAFAREGTDGLTPLLQKCAAAFGVSDIDEASGLFDGVADETTWDSESLAHHRRTPDESLVAHERLQVEEDARHGFLRQVAAWREAGYEVAFVVAKEGEEQRAQEILAGDAGLQGIKPDWLRGSLNEGFRITFRAGAELSWKGKGSPHPGTRKRGEDNAPSARAAGLVVVTETEIFGRQRQRRSVLNPRASAPRSTSCSIFRNWWRAISSSTSSMASPTTADSPSSTPPRASGR
jgi:transcription-repair coupling factor (superfamily II helicase)